MANAGFPHLLGLSQALRARILDEIPPFPPVLSIEADPDSRGNWEFSLIRSPADNLEIFASLSSTCRQLRQEMRSRLFGNTRFEVTIGRSRLRDGEWRKYDLEGLVKQLRSLVVVLTPERETRSRADAIINLTIQREEVQSVDVDLSPIMGNKPAFVSDAAMEEEVDIVDSKVEHEMKDAVLPHRQRRGMGKFKMGMFAKAMSLLDEAMGRYAALEGREWVSEELQWMDGMDVDVVGDQRLAGNVEMEDVNEADREGDAGSEGSEMSVDDGVA